MTIESTYISVIIKHIGLLSIHSRVLDPDQLTEAS